MFMMIQTHQKIGMIKVNKKEFYCDGPEDGEHPRVYYIMDDTNEKICMYCNEKFIYEED